MSQLKRLKFYRCRVSSLPDNPFGKRPKFALNEFFVFKVLETGYFKNETSYLASVVSVFISSSGRFPCCYRTLSLI